jgi:tRNA threonylcarbamoyladenosine modification (KEOPS) complex  Pcc1 subunit
MKYNARISVNGDSELITKVFAAEDKQIKEASFKIEKARNSVHFDLQAEDSVALRTALNSITKVLTVIEKTMRIK